MRIIVLKSRSRCWDGIFGHYEADMTDGLIELCSKWLNKEMVGVEVGSFAGASSEVIAFHCKHLTSVDPWQKCCDTGYKEISREKIILAEKQFDLVLEKCKNMSKINDFSLNACSNFKDRSLDFVYIDGAHDYESAYNDIIAWEKKIKFGGLLMGHDKGLIEKSLKDAGIIVIEQFKDTSWVSIVKQI